MYLNTTIRILNNLTANGQFNQYFYDVTSTACTRIYNTHIKNNF